MMKKMLISICTVCTIVALCVMVSCEKPLMGEKSDEPKGNLKVTVYEIEKTPFGSLTRGVEPVSNVCTRLNFAIYDMGGSRVKLVNQTKGTASFGEASFQLEEGDYQLVVLAHSAKIIRRKNEKIYSYSCNSDTFLWYEEVTIGEEPVELNVSLDRIVALCRFVITDDFPADVTQMRFYYTGGSGAFNATTGLGCVNSKQEVKFDVTTGQKQFDLYTFLHAPSDEIALKVTALDAAGNELYAKEFDVPMQQNYITWLTGAFFNGSGSSSTVISGVTVDTDWAGETHISF